MSSKHPVQLISYAAHVEELRKMYLPRIDKAIADIDEHVRYFERVGDVETTTRMRGLRDDMNAQRAEFCSKYPE